jgi:hypothetical protein
VDVILRYQAANAHKRCFRRHCLDEDVGRAAQGVGRVDNEVIQKKRRGGVGLKDVKKMVQRLRAADSIIIMLQANNKKTLIGEQET